MTTQFSAQQAKAEAPEYVRLRDGASVDHLSEAAYHLRAACFRFFCGLCGGAPGPSGQPTRAVAAEDVQEAPPPSLGTFDDTVLLPTSTVKERWDICVMVRADSLA